MTKFKKYLRAKGVLLECDIDAFPNMGIHHVETHVLGDCIEVLTCYMDSPFTDQVVFDNNGRWSAPCERLYEGCGAALNGCDDYVAWLCHTSCKISTALYPVAVCMYERDEKVRIAFKHMLAGIMSEEVLYKYIVRQYPKYISRV